MASKRSSPYRLQFSLLCSQMHSSTPLHVALAGACHDHIPRLLINHGADLANRNIEGKTPLHTFYNPVISTILSYTSQSLDDEVMTSDRYGMTVAHYIAWSSKSRPECLSFRNMQRHQFLLLERDHHGRSVLHFTCDRGNIAVLRYLLGLVVDIAINCRDDAGRTILHYAVHTKRTEAIKLVVSHGVEIHAVDLKGRTALHYAAMHDNVAAVQQVLELGGHIDLFCTDVDGRTPYELAYRRKAFRVTRYLETVNVGCVSLKHTLESLSTVRRDVRPGLFQRWTFSTAQPTPGIITVLLFANLLLLSFLFWS